jgi:hypothetical protein
VSGTEPDLSTWEGLIEYQRGRGLTADEIVDVFDHTYAHGFAAIERLTRSGEWLNWGLLHGRRRIEPLIKAIASKTPTEGAVRAELDRRIAAGEPHGYDALARHFQCSDATIRRRLGVLDAK